MRTIVPTVGLVFLFAASTAGIGTAQTPAPAVQITSLSVERSADGITVQIKTSGPVKYQPSFMDSPNRLVIDLPGAIYAWNRTTLKSDGEPVRQVRGGQWKAGTARIVVELARKVGYRIDEDSDGLVIVLEPTGTAQIEKPAQKVREAKTPDAKTKVAPAPAAAETPAAGGDAPRVEARTSEPAKTESRRETEAMAVAGQSPPPTPEPKPAAAPLRVAQAAAPAPTPPPGGQATAPSGEKLISLDFKDADIVNLLRILAAESGRNMVVGDDVKGKVSISLHNVTWEQALNTILEARGLQRLDRDGVIRIVSLEQLTKEREAQARVREAQVKAENEMRSKRAEAELKEVEAANRKFQSEARIADAQARGPLREEAFRLAYADPGEVANTLQGILALGQQAADIKPCRTIERKAGGETKVTVSTGGGATSGPIAEPPFSQLFGPPPPPQQATPPLPPVPEDLAGKGLAIRTHCPTNTLFLRLFAADLERTKKLIKEHLDIPLPQVKIEARMEILDRSAFEGIGVQWGGAAATNINGTTTAIGQGFQTTAGGTPAFTGVLTPGGVVYNPVGVNNLTPPNPNLNLSQLFPVSATTGLPLGGNIVNLPFAALPGAANAGPAAGGISFGLVSNRYNLNLALQALATQGKTRTLARPEIVMVENTLGSISLGEEIPYATVSSAGTQIQFKEAALRLDVFPTVVREQIGPKVVNRFKMVVTVENNSRGENINPGGGSTIPIIEKRKAETQVLIKEGDRLVIGGVTQGVSSTTVRKVPLFGDIPVLGWLFKQKENSETGRELVIFVTPSLVIGQGTAGMSLTPIAPR